jgi:hypothetical protein
MKLSNQALMSIMVALQKSLMEQSDIVPVLKDFDLELNDASELEVTNPPTQIAVPKNTLEEEF